MKKIIKAFHLFFYKLLRFTYLLNKPYYKH